MKPYSAHSISFVAFEAYNNKLTYSWYEGLYSIDDDNNKLSIDIAETNVKYRCVVKPDNARSEQDSFSISLDIENHFRLYPSGTTCTDSDQMSGSGFYFKVYIPPDAIYQTYSVAALADNTEGITYQWFRYGYNYDENDDYVLIENETGSSITVETDVPDMTRICHVTDKYGNSRWVGFQPEWENHFTAVASGTESKIQILYVEPGEIIDLSVDIYADDMDDIACKWCRDYVEIENNADKTIESADKICLQTDPIIEKSVYNCIITDKYGTDNSVDFYIYPLYEFPVYRMDEEQFVTCNAGESAELKIKIPEEIMQKTSKMNLDYQHWYFQDEDGHLQYVTDYPVRCRWFKVSEDGMREDCLQDTLEREDEFSFVTPPIEEEVFYNCYIMDDHFTMEPGRTVKYVFTYHVTPRQ